MAHVVSSEALHSGPTCNVFSNIAHITENIDVCVYACQGCQPADPVPVGVCSSVDMAYSAWQLTSHTSQGLHNNTPCRGDSLIGFLKESLACICILIDKCFFRLPIFPWLSLFFKLSLNYGSIIHPWHMNSAFLEIIQASQVISFFLSEIKFRHHKENIMLVRLLNNCCKWFDLQYHQFNLLDNTACQQTTCHYS